MSNPILTPIDYLNGLGPQRAEVLKSELKLFNCRDLLYHFPFRYIDKTKFYTLKEITNFSSEIQIKGTIINMQEVGEGRKKRIHATFQDETGQADLVWFKYSPWLKKKNSDLIAKPIVIFGKPSLFQNRISFTHPEMETESAHQAEGKGLEPVYSTTEKIQKKGITPRIWRGMIEQVLEMVNPYIRENLSSEIKRKYDLIDRNKAFYQIHFPKNAEELNQAQKRLKFEEFYFLHLSLQMQKAIGKKKFKSQAFSSVGDYFNDFYHHHLGFELTNAQKRVIREIRSDMAKSSQMNRLLQGDVGSGKTIVAFMSMLIAADNGFQSLLMAPTEILAQQHYYGLKQEADKMGLEIALLTGSTKTAERREIHQKLEDGSLHFLVGTHALIEDKVKFKNLGFAIIDEQHRFGVAQRAKIFNKGILPPHMLIMTATPIPRTLAMTLYGDLDISIIDELPAGRKPIQTHHMLEKDRLKLLGFMRREIEKGRQIYIVYPLIEESQQLDYKALMDGYDYIATEFPYPDFAISIVHGQMKPADKDYEMQRFAKGETDIMVATTVIEVGVNVPNASVMIIESAEKFGLSQLHQLRGRVGRGGEQSYCILMTKDKLNETAYKRIQTMCQSTDGFRIAEVDLELRGPGNVMGTQQSGILNLKIADLKMDKTIFQAARKAVEDTLEEDFNLSMTKNANILHFFNLYHKKKIGWANVG
ncbi:ATP-dependent DNA helicase RecG [Ornithobacterium rhinotracheale]|uniref:ATP-dependent DNA helicase RecG n=1 Tax=Ornithobacterium rhinotracheale TaxID=28251 RepID=UPI001FF50037|nr:ATP-dependent DNA helicase RecG [Ornithobacterium rhinotracheale]